MNFAKPTDPISFDTYKRLERYKCVIPNAAVNIGAPHGKGGTGFLNINANEGDAAAVCEVLSEINCSCIFILPAAVFGIVPFENDDAQSWETFRQVLSLKTPPYLSVHQIPTGSDECLQLFKQLMIQELASTVPGSVSVRTAVMAQSFIEVIKNKN